MKISTTDMFLPAKIPMSICICKHDESSIDIKHPIVITLRVSVLEQEEKLQDTFIANRKLTRCSNTEICKVYQKKNAMSFE
jgi:hypothetical protein